MFKYVTKFMFISKIKVVLIRAKTVVNTLYDVVKYCNNLFQMNLHSVTYINTIMHST